MVGRPVRTSRAPDGAKTCPEGLDNNHTNFGRSVKVGRVPDDMVGHPMLDGRAPDIQEFSPVTL